jgi:hypothetical protein
MIVPSIQLISIHELIHELAPDGAKDARTGTGAERSSPANRP